MVTKVEHELCNSSKLHCSVSSFYNRYTCGPHSSVFPTCVQAKKCEREDNVSSRCVEVLTLPVLIFHDPNRFNSSPSGLEGCVRAFTSVPSAKRFIIFLWLREFANWPTSINLLLNVFLRRCCLHFPFVCHSRFPRLARCNDHFIRQRSRSYFRHVASTAFFFLRIG